MSSIRTETETVVKRILPYLRRRGYDPENDIDFETAVKSTDHYGKGYVDLLVTCGKPKPLFLIEAKRNGKTLTERDRKQALGYGDALGVAFVVVTNGSEVQVLGTKSRLPLKFNGKLAAKVPSADQVSNVLKQLRSNPLSTEISIGTDSTLPYRPGLPLKRLNALFSRCHNKIRNIEKNEEHAFADFSKILFLRLLEEKAERGEYTLPYSYRFHELAERPQAEADQVRDAVVRMLEDIRKVGYGDVLIEPLYLKKAPTFQYLVQQLSSVSFEDSGLDSKGAAFEYFVRATLKGKRLGQYFTPRPLVDLMLSLVGRDVIVGSLRAGTDVKVLDPACGTGGFLVFLLKTALRQVDDLYEARKLTRSSRDALRQRIMSQTFYGADANDGVAAAAKMNMIVAGDGHTNIVAEDSLARSSTIWSFDQGRYDFILTNPPFGTSESSSLSASDLAKYEVPTSKGQLLFLQRMVLASKPGGMICTVIDEGVLNTDTASPLRRWILQRCEVVAVVQLPDETFKPNKITVRSSLLLLRRRETPDVDFDDNYHITFCRLDAIGYLGSGETIRGFDFDKLRDEFESDVLRTGSERLGEHWRAFDVDVKLVVEDQTARFDLKYWDPGPRDRVMALAAAGVPTVRSINTLPTSRGKSPASDLYVDQADGYALVVKAGTNVSKYGQILDEVGADYIEKVVYDDMPERVKLRIGDILISSTGDGTLGKVAVYDWDRPAIADGHVTIVRLDPKGDLDPYYVCDYLRAGFGATQIRRLYTGSTGLIELTTDHVDSLVIEAPHATREQRELSAELRAAEGQYQEALAVAEESLSAARDAFSSPFLGGRG